MNMKISEQLLWFENLKDSPGFMAESNKIDFAYEIEKAISAKGISQSKFAEIVGVSPAYISKVLRGDANLTIETMTKLADAIGKCLHLYLANKNATVEFVESFADIEAVITAVPVGNIYVSTEQLNEWNEDNRTSTSWSSVSSGTIEISSYAN